MDRLNVAEAASVLGITQAAVYKRIQRGTISHTKDDEGQVFVYLDLTDIPFDRSMDGSNKSTDRSMDGSNSEELLAELRTYNEHLLQEVEAWREESRRKDAIIMTMAQRIPELEPAREASPEPRESSQPVPENAGNGDYYPPDSQEPEQRRSWLYRFFFGPE